MEQELISKWEEQRPTAIYLEFTQCVGQCQGTPIITINKKPYINVDPGKIPAILASINFERDKTMEAEMRIVLRNYDKIDNLKIDDYNNKRL